MQQHVVLVYTNQLREDSPLPIGGSLLMIEGLLEQVENRYDPLDRLVSFTGTVNGDCRDCQSCASPRASSDGPHPLEGGG